MPRPTNKAALLETAKENFAKLFALIEKMPLHLQEAELPYNERDKTLRDVLTHLYEWQELLLAFVRTNLNKTSNFAPFLPAPYNFKTYPKYNREILQKHQSTPLQKAKEMLQESFTNCIALIESLPPKTLFVKKHYAWCGNTSLGSYCVSATSSHYDWAIKCVKKAIKNK